MKKILSAALAALMVSSSVLCAGFTASAEESVSRPQYGTANALRHEGGFAWLEMEGKTVKTVDAGEGFFVYNATDEYDAGIVLDGNVTEEEWGSPTLMLDPEYMARKGNNTTTSDNAYFWSEEKGSNGYNGVPTTAKVWFRWDDKYMYIAAIVTDSDGHLNSKSGQDTWDGDALQFRIDPLGPNSGVPAGEKYNARPTELYDKVNQRVYKQPWANTIIKNPVAAATESYSAVGNFGVSFTTKPSGGGLGKCSIFDMGLRYDMTVEAVKQSDGTPVLDENGEQKYEEVWHGKDMYPGTGNPYGDTYASVKGYTVRSSDPNYDANLKQKMYTHYEIAIPWTQVGENFAPTAGHKLGMAFGIVNAAAGKSYNNSWLTWGSGIFGKQIADAEDTCGGSNCVVLSEDSEFSIKCDHENWNDPTCEGGYKCADCGTAERGFIAGHAYNYTNGASPTATTPGTITCDCPTCGDHKEIVIPAKAAKKLVWYDQDSASIPGELDGYKIAFMDNRDPDCKTPYVDDYGNKLTSLTQTFEGYKVIDGTYGSFGTYVQYTSAKDIYDKHKGDDSEFDGSYAVNYDFNIQKLGSPKFNNPWQDEKGEWDKEQSEYRDGIWHWFGGKSGMAYMAGYFPVEDKVIIMEFYGDNYKENKPYKAIAESEKLGLNLNEWHNMRFEYDSVNQAVFMYIDDELVTYAWHDGFATGKTGAFSCIHRTMDLNVYYKDVVYSTVSYGHGSDVPPAPVEYNVVIDGVSRTAVAGETVTLTPPAMTKDDNGNFHRFYQWTVNNGDVTIENDSFVMPEGDVEIVSNTTVIGDVDKSGTINGRDCLFIKRSIIGLMTLTDEQVASADIDLDGSVNGTDVLLIKRMCVGSYAPTK